MSAPVTTREFLELVRKSGLVESDQLKECLRGVPITQSPAFTPLMAAKALIEAGLLTRFQAKHLLGGRYKGMVFGPYILLEMLGQGGTGVVFLAQHKTLPRLVALKVLTPDRARSEEALQRFYREARAVALLNHPNIVRGYDVSRWENYHYLVMDFVEGKSLQQIIDLHGPLPWVKATHYILQVAAGLQHAHDNGLVHRDIKPSNLFLDRSGIVKILDFGLARFFDDVNDRLTQDFCKGALLGTADYLAPEQAVHCHKVDIRADIYSLGATFYTLLIGKPPFHESRLAQKLVDHQLKTPVVPHQINPQIPPEISTILLKMMAKRPEQRFQVPAELAEALLLVLEGKIETIDELDLQNDVDTIRIKLPPELIVLYQQQQLRLQKDPSPILPKKSQSGLREVMQKVRALLG